MYAFNAACLGSTRSHHQADKIPNKRRRILHNVIIHPPHQLYVWESDCTKTRIAVYDQRKLVDLKECVISNKVDKYFLDNAIAYSNKGVCSCCILYLQNLTKDR